MSGSLLALFSMEQSKRLWRTSLFVILLAALCGSFAFPLVNAPVGAAPRMQATGCVGTTIAQWTFENVTTPTVGTGTFNSGSGLSAPSYAGGDPGQAVSFTNWTTAGAIDTIDFVEFLVPTAGRNAMGFSFDYRATGTGPATLEIHYSVDGGSNFALFGTPFSLNRDSAFHTLTVDLSSIPALNDNGNAVFRIYAYAAGGNTGTLRLDDALFTGNCIFPADTETPTPTATGAVPLSVLINEVAWSGTSAGNTDEWFELYNTTGAPINLAGWRLEADDGNPTIALSGTINAGDYFVVAKSAGVFNDLSADLIASSISFENEGEILTLLDPNGNQVDAANLDGGAWPAGLGSPSFATMERTGVVADSASAWFTYNGTTPVAHDRNGGNIRGTPGQANWITTVTITPSPTITNTPTRTSTPGLCGVGIPPTSVIISEVAWAGTGASTSDEWIELYNPTANTINLNGWILKGLDGTPSISLSDFNLAPGGFYVLERGDDTTISDVTANLIFTGELGNTNEVLQLYNFLGVCVDTANSNSGAWPAGSTVTYGSMERLGVVTDSDAAWITNVQSSTWQKHDARGTSSANNLIHGTPGYANWAFSVTPTASPARTSTPRPTPTRTVTPLPPPPLLVINEFVPRPGHDWNGDGTVNVDDEYIEILNHGVVNVNLSGYSLDDEVNIGSAPYRLPSLTLRPGERIVFYGSETALLLSDGGDGVRLLRPNGQLMDAYNYFVVGYPDQAYCRLPDNGGADDWNQNCYPTPGLQNSLSSEPIPTHGEMEELFCPIADTLPEDFAQAECDPYGHEIWRAEYWDRTGWYGEKFLPGLDGRWPVYAD
jgi:hypothetical protein